MTPAERATRAAGRFQLPGPIGEVTLLHGGLIHESWRVEAGGRSWVVQHLNQSVFHDIEGLMENVAAITTHLARRLTQIGDADARRRSITLVKAEDGRWWLEEEDGAAWRCMPFIGGTVVKQSAATLEDAREAGRAFGEFTHLMEGFDEPLAITIPGFHHTATRVSALERAVERDEFARADIVPGELEVLRELEPLAHILPPLLAAGALPIRPVHNDSKISNILFDATSGRATTILDLDTVMPGTALHDIGDLIRSTVGSAPEDVAEAGAMKVRAEFLRALVAGWFEGTAGALSTLERELTLTAGRIITYEQAVRFLTDYLEGDRYYVTRRPGHNLDRARAQIALLLDLTERADELEEIVALS